MVLVGNKWWLVCLTTDTVALGHVGLDCRRCLLFSGSRCDAFLLRYRRIRTRRICDSSGRSRHVEHRQVTGEVRRSQRVKER
ncbi:hypothetical protein BKA57DRAFT_475342 [Linnemannia elongata]|nr:hypothetical protein BKA57DRAFT_475342 [Linnemannia elongata]